NCGTCGNVCPGGGSRSTAGCVAGRCVLTCESGWGDCNGSTTDGCETDLEHDVEHCGACDRDCRSCGGVSCSDGACAAKTLSTRPRNVDLLALSDTHVTYSDDQNISQVSKTDASVQSIYAVERTPGLRVGGGVFFIYPGTESFSGIYRTSAGLIGPQIAAYARGEDAEAMALDDSGLYYAVALGGGVSRLLRCKDCNTPTELSKTENSFRNDSIALDATTVFYGAGDMIRRIEKTGADLKTIAVNQKPRSLAVDTTHVYWINEGPIVFDDAGPPKGAVVRVPKTGGTPETIVSGLVQPLHLAVGGEHLYVADRGNKVVFRTDKDGKNRLDLATNLTELGGIALDDRCVWFAAGPEIRQLVR
ncbi:MAG: hypothetical protein K0S65_195, partial [Labilithrix sp.]|nr:hypothetical protein [Labilithrix sp.]